MIDTKLLEEFIPNIDTWQYADVKKIKLLTKGEVQILADDVRYEYHSDKDVIDVCITALYYMKQLEEMLKSK